MSISDPRQQHGFTLIETLVAMISGVIVTGALFEIFVVSLHQTNRLTDSVQASQIGRTAMTHIVDELHSACMSREFAPIQRKSTYSKLIFRTGYSEKTTIAAAEASEHTITYTGTAVIPGKLTDLSTKGSSGAWPNFTYAGATNSTTVAENVYAPSLDSENNKHAVFKYYKYSSTASQGTSTDFVGLSRRRGSLGKRSHKRPSKSHGRRSRQFLDRTAQRPDGAQPSG